MSRFATSFVLGYHGCSREVGKKALNQGLSLSPSTKDYDWLGPGVYFWESDPQRASEWAAEKAASGAYKEPFVLGAVIDLGNCLDLMVRDNLELLASAHQSLSRFSRLAGFTMPKNRDPRTVNRGDKLLRYLDCAVIKHLHAALDDGDVNPPGLDHIEPFDTVRGLFVEGERAYRGSGFFSKSHTQIAVRNDRCIKGLFVPR